MITSQGSYSVKAMGGIWVSKISKLLNYINNNYVGIHWYREKFRHPPMFGLETSWAKELIEFEKRLEVNGKVKNISSKGFISRGVDLTTYPSGHSSCSYVFDLSKKNLFEELYLKLDDNN